MNRTPWGRLAATLATTLAAASAAAAPAAPPPAPAPAVQSHTIEMFAKGSSKAHPFKVSFDAALYAQGGKGKDLTPATASGPDEAFLISSVETYRTGTLEQALKLWLPEEREHKRRTMTANDNRVFARNQAVHKDVARVELLAKVLYGDYTLFGMNYHLNKGEVHALVYPAVNRGGQYYFTDGLSDDPVFTFLMNRVVRELSSGNGARGER